MPTAARTQSASAVRFGICDLVILFALNTSNSEHRHISDIIRVGVFQHHDNVRMAQSSHDGGLSSKVLRASRFSSSVMVICLMGSTRLAIRSLLFILERFSRRQYSWILDALMHFAATSMSLHRHCRSRPRHQSRCDAFDHFDFG